MFKSLKQNIVFLFMLFIIPLTIGSVDCSWVYYEGNVIDQSININNIILGKFNYVPYPNEYPDTPEGQQNNDIFDHISGGNVKPEEGPNGWPLPPSNDGVSLTDPKSPINDALSITNLDRKKPYISSLDYFDTNGNKEIDSNDKTALEYFYGKDADPNTSFIIVRETFDDFFKQTYSIYTTTVNMKKMKNGELVKYVYKTQVIWTRNKVGQGITEGKYTVSTTGNVRGTCEVKKGIKVTNANGDNVSTNKMFFDYKTFVQVK